MKIALNAPQLLLASFPRTKRMCRPGVRAAVLTVAVTPSTLLLKVSTGDMAMAVPPAHGGVLM